MAAQCDGLGTGSATGQRNAGSVSNAIAFLAPRRLAGEARPAAGAAARSAALVTRPRAAATAAAAVAGESSSPPSPSLPAPATPSLARPPSPGRDPASPRFAKAAADGSGSTGATSERAGPSTRSCRILVSRPFWCMDGTMTSTTWHRRGLRPKGKQCTSPLELARPTRDRSPVRTPRGIVRSASGSGSASGIHTHPLGSSSVTSRIVVVRPAAIPARIATCAAPGGGEASARCRGRGPEALTAAAGAAKGTRRSRRGYHARAHRRFGGARPPNHKRSCVGLRQLTLLGV